MPDFELPNVPPSRPQFEVSKPPQLKRIPFAMVAVLLMFVSLLGMNLVSKSPSQALKNPTEAFADKFLELKVAMKSASTPSESGAAMFTDDIEDLLDGAKTDPNAQRMRVALRVEDRQKPFAADLEKLKASKVERNRIFAQLYETEKPTKAQIDQAEKALDMEKLDSKLAIIHAKERAGQTGVRAKYLDLGRATLFAVFTFGVLTAATIGFGLWVFYGNARSNGRLIPRGQPYYDAVLAEADRLCIAAFAVLVSFVVGQLLGSVGSIVVLFAMILVVFRQPIFGMKISRERLGLNLQNFKSKLAWAGAGFFANLPILLFASLFASLVSRFVSGGAHPASSELLQNPTALTVAKIMLLACVVAPIWEEIVFRGFLFSAFTKYTKSPIVGGLVSSVLFASVHPQGLVGLIPLTALGGMMCALTYQTRSIVPGMIFHGLHNGATLLFSIVIGRAFGL